MSITFTKAYVAGDKTYATLREAQVAAIQAIIDKADPNDPNSVAETIVAESEQVVCALTTTERSKPRARAVNGGKKPRKNRVTEPAATTAA